MFGSKGLRVLSILLFLMISGGIAAGQCVADGNNSAKTASPLPLSGMFSDWVCPDDPWDYFSIEIPASTAGYGGYIIFTPAQTGTTIDITSPALSSAFFTRKGSTDTQKEIRIDINPGDMKAGTYYMRIGFYSAYNTDHSYSLNIALEETQCFPDNNDTPETAWTILINDSARNYVCDADQIDYWKFTVTNEYEGRGEITLDNDTGFVKMFLYDSSKSEIFQGKTENGTLIYNLETNPPGSSGTPPAGYSNYGLAPGDYYIGIQLPKDGAETGYIITHKSLPVETLPGEGIIMGVETVVTIDPGLILALSGIWVRVVVDSLFCFEESDYDEGSNSDEPYPVFKVRAGNQTGWTDLAEAFYSFDDVDDFESRAVAWEDREVYAGEIPYGQALEVIVDLYEADTGEDDTIGDRVVNTIQPDVLLVWSGSENNRTFEAMFRGGSEGRYVVRYHLEFNHQSSTKFNAKFTQYGAFMTGNFQGSGADEILIIVDEEDLPWMDGRFYFYDGVGNLLKTWEKLYTSYDLVAVGDVNGDGFDDVIVADDESGHVRGYDYNGNVVCDFKVAVTRYDGFAVADINGDGKCEFFLAKDDDDTVRTYNSSGTIIRELKLDFDFKGVRYTGPDSHSDAFLVGNVLGDSRQEFVLVRYKLGYEGEMFVYDAVTGSVVHHVQTIRDLAIEGLIYSLHDAVYLADVRGDARLELLVACHEGDGYAGLIISALDLTINGRVAIYSWPHFTQYDGFAAGDVLNQGSNQIMITSDDDQIVYITLN